MTIAHSTGSASSHTSLMASQFTGGFIRLFSGTRPASPDLAETGTLLGIVSVNGLSGAGLHFTAAGAALQKAAGEPWVFHALADGDVSWFRIVGPGDTGAIDLEALRIDGDVGTADDAADMTWTSTAVLNGHPYTLNQFFYLLQPIGH